MVLEMSFGMEFDFWMTGAPTVSRIMICGWWSVNGWSVRAEDVKSFKEF